jgi:glutamate carboxypeptidase
LRSWLFHHRYAKHHDRVSRDLGYGSIEPFDPGGRGAADISFVAKYVDGLDGLGVPGEGEHSPKERVYLSSLEKATKLAAILTYRLTR